LYEINRNYDDTKEDIKIRIFHVHYSTKCDVACTRL